MDRELSSKKFIAVCSEAYLSSLREFILGNTARALAKQRLHHGMFEAMEKEEEWDAETDLSLGATGNV